LEQDFCVGVIGAARHPVKSGEREQLSLGVDGKHIEFDGKRVAHILAMADAGERPTHGSGLIRFEAAQATAASARLKPLPPKECPSCGHGTGDAIELPKN
jgi:hypothetical protein